MHIPVRCQVIIDNDWAGDPDGLVALAHHLLSPANEVLAITSSLTNPMFGPPSGRAEAGGVLARTLLGHLGSGVPVAAGLDVPFDGSVRRSEAARRIIDAATASRDLPLILVCGGPLTNIADALVAAPEIASKFILAWVGGSITGADEYNESTDQTAADFVLANPHLVVWQFPLECYRRLTLSVAELEYSLTGGGVTGRWLWEQFETLPLPDFVKLGPLWCLGDSAPLIVTALEDLTSTFEVRRAQPERRIYTEVDARMILGDLFARLRLAAHDGLGIPDAIPDRGTHRGRGQGVND